MPEPVAVPPPCVFRFAERVEGFLADSSGSSCRFDEGDAVAVGLVDLVDRVAAAFFAGPEVVETTGAAGDCTTVVVVPPPLDLTAR